MGFKTSAENVTAFLERQEIHLDEVESHKLTDYSAEHGGVQSSFLGKLFVLTKKLLQEESLISGLANCLKKDTLWEDTPVYGAFWHDHKLFDDLSNYFGNQYRGSFIFNYLMGAFAVLAALIPVGFNFELHFGHRAHSIELLFTVIELLTILAILFLFQIGANPHNALHSRSFLGIKLNRRWHEKWIEYRILAERFRYMEILYPIGIDPRVEGAAKKDELGEWINAYFAMRLTQQKVESSNDMAAYSARLLDIMKGQAEYHKKNSHRAEHIHHRLHTFSQWLFYATLAACVAHFVWHQTVLTLASGFFPALAAAIHGILSSGEFSKTAEISKLMQHKINLLTDQLANPCTQEQIRLIAIDFHNIVIGDALRWRSIFIDKNVPLA